WQSPKKLLAAGALLVLTSTSTPAQAPSTEVQESPPLLPAPAEVAVRPAASAPSSPLATVSQADGERLPAPTTPSQTAVAPTPSPAGPLAYSSNGGDYRRHTHPPLLAHRDYQAPALGVMMHQAFQTQVNNGIAAQIILYDYDFVCGHAKLNLRGSDRLWQIAQMWMSYNYPLIIPRPPY